MSPRSHLAALLVLASCARTALNPECPVGYTHDGEKCICATDEGCPRGHACQEGVCVCRSSECCPEGYQYSADSEACVCRSSACCPADHVFRDDEQKCTCGAEDCCPQGYVFLPDAGACACAADECCPKGFAWDPKQQKCTCASDECCPYFTQNDGGTSLFRYDPARKDCVCASDECCPPNYRYSDAVRACVCVGDACCPAGYRKDPQKERCVCISDAACGVGRVCDMVSGACKCTSNAGCASGSFCNSLGFCQSIAACTSNAECPAGMFCDITTNRCIANGPCTLDEHCALDNICNATVSQCRAGCRRDGDCKQKTACVNNLCIDFCRTNQSCPVMEFCNPTSGSCAIRPNRTDCRDCTSSPTVCTSTGLQASCLTFVSEGQNTRRFCGVHCRTQEDCPSGFECGGVIFTCNSEGASCPPDAQAPGEQMRCKSFLVENEPGPQLFCADSTGQPHEYFKACAPSSGFCPATAAP